MDPEGKSPFDEDVIEPPRIPKKEAPLSEKNFIHEPPGSFVFPLWLWLFLGTALIAIVWGSKEWFSSVMQNVKKNEPFLQVTNREFSQFLWQFPGYLRANAAQKTGYLPAFQPDRVVFESKEGDAYVIAPPEVLFLYHTWNRLLGKIYIPTSISSHDFIEFLKQVPEWQPENWKEASVDYKNWIASKGYEADTDLQNTPSNYLPLEVRRAFQGWKNFFIDGVRINDLKPNVGDVNAFIESHPEYSRNFWRNIDEVASIPVAGLNYLMILLHGMPPKETVIPSDQLSGFLRAALFNSEQQQK